MNHQRTSRRVSHAFEVEIECDEAEEGERRYQAWCRGLAGCWVYAGTRAKAVRKIRRAIGIWLELANRQMEGQETSTADVTDSIVGE